MRIRKRVIALALAGAAAVSVVGAGAAEAAVKLEGPFGCGGTTYHTCYYNYDTKDMPGSTGTIDLGVQIQMNSSGASYCPYLAAVQRNNTTKAQSYSSVDIWWTDANQKQHVATSQPVNIANYPVGETLKAFSPLFTWFDSTTRACGLSIPRGQSSTLNTHTQPNGVTFYGHNSSQYYKVRIDLY